MLDSHYSSDEDMSYLQSPTSSRSQPGVPAAARRSMLVPTNTVTTKDGQTVRNRLRGRAYYANGLECIVAGQSANRSVIGEYLCSGRRGLELTPPVDCQ